MMSLGSTLTLEDNAASYHCELETLERPRRPLFGTHDRLCSDEDGLRYRQIIEENASRSHGDFDGDQGN